MSEDTPMRMKYSSVWPYSYRLSYSIEDCQEVIDSLLQKYECRKSEIRRDFLDLYGDVLNYKTEDSIFKMHWDKFKDMVKEDRILQFIEEDIKIVCRTKHRLHVEKYGSCEHQELEGYCEDCATTRRKVRKSEFENLF
jgi:hypothetical protein